MRRCWGLAPLALLLSLAFLCYSSFAQTDLARGVLLRGLDKITARITTFELPLGKEVKFGTLRIVAQTCRKRPPEETPEVAVFLEIDEVLPGKGGRQQLFTGWMFASSPALSALEHSVYDVWVIDCSTVAEVKDLPERLKSPTTDKAEANRE